MSGSFKPSVEFKRPRLLFGLSLIAGAFLVVLNPLRNSATSATKAGPTLEIAFTKASYGASELPELRLTLRNSLDAPISVARTGHSTVTIYATPFEKGGRVRKGKVEASFITHPVDAAGQTLATLVPGASSNFSILFFAPDVVSVASSARRMSNTMVSFDRPGRYDVSVSYQYKGADKTFAAVFHGKLRSNSATLTLAPE